jgi:hypothetical protein
LILTLTPRIIRIPDIREEDLAALFIGTEGNPHLRGAATSPFGPDPFAAREDADGEAAEEEGEEDPAEEDAEPASGESGAKKASEESKPAAKSPETKPAAGAKPAESKPAEKPPAPSPAPANPPPPKTPEAQVAPGAEVQEAPPSSPGAGVPLEVLAEDELPEEEEEIDEANIPTPEPPPAPKPPPTAAPVTVALAPGRITVAGQGGFAFNVMVAGASNMQRLSLTVKFDPAVAEFDHGLEGIFMRADGTPTQFSAQKAGDGTVNVEIRRTSGDKGVSGSGSTAALRFKPVAPGRTLINIVRAEAVDPAGRPIPVNPSGADVTVSP